MFLNFPDSNFSTNNFSLTYWFNTPVDRAAGWHHFAGVHDDASLLLYLDRVLRDQLAIPPGMNIQVPSNFGISQSPCIGTGDAVSLIGEMDDFRVYERALTPEEVAAAFNVLFADSFEDKLSP